MLNQFRMIAKVWVYRPMMWLMAIVTLFVLLIASSDRNRTMMRSAFVLPSEFGSTAITATTLKDGDAFLQSAQSDKVDNTVEGVDLKSMDLTGPDNPRGDLSSLEHALANYPSVRWIRFGRDQIQHVRSETFNQLRELDTIIIHDDQVSQNDIDQLLEVPRLQTLILETLDLPASLKSLSALLNLETLVLSHSSFRMIDRPIDSLFRPQVLTQIHDLRHLRRLVLMPQWLPGEAFFADDTTMPDPACDPVLKANAARLLPGHPSLTDLWLGVAKHEQVGKDLAMVQATMPNVNVRSARYNEKSITRAGLGALAIVLLTWICFYNLSGHLSTPHRRVIPNYAIPHMRFVFGFALLTVMVSAGMLRAPSSIAWLPAIAVSSLAVTLAVTLMANMTIINIRNPELVWIASVFMFALFPFQVIRPFLRPVFPAMEPALDRFLGGDHPFLAIAIAAACLPAISWVIRQFQDNDRINAEAGLPPLITVEDFGKQNEILGLQRRGRTFQRVLNAWQSKLNAVKSEPRGWLRDVRLDGMGEPTLPLSRWIGILLFATVVAFALSRLSFDGRDFATIYVVVMTVGAAMTIPLIASLSRRDVAPSELLFPNSRAEFMRRRTLSVAIKFSYLFAALLVFVPVVQYLCFQTLILENLVRAAIVFAATTIAGTGIVLWGSSIRNIFAFGLLVVVGLVLLTFASMSCLDFRWIDNEQRGERFHAFVSSPLFYAGSFLVSGLLLWSGHFRLSRCELARQ